MKILTRNIFIFTISIVCILHQAYSQTYAVQSYTSFSEAHCFLDLGDSIWIGTEGGLAIYRKSLNDFAFLTNCGTGLKDNIIQAIVRDSSDNIWVGTYSSGLYKFDGSNWTVFDTSNSPLNSNNIRVLQIDTSGNLWIASDILYKYDGNSWITYTVTTQGVHLNDIRHLVVDKNNLLWLSVSSHGFFNFNGNTWVQYDPNTTGIQSFSSISDIGLDNVGTVWILSDNILYHYSSGQLLPAPTSPWGPSMASITFACDSLGVFWISGQTNGIYKFDGVNWVHYDSTYTNCFSSKNFILKVYVDKDQNIWFGALHKGVVRYNGSNFQAFDLCPTIGGNRVKEIDFLHNTTALIATDFGLSTYSGSQFLNYNSANGNYLWQVQSVKADLNDAWICNSAGEVFKYDLNTTWSQIPLPQYSVFSIYTAMNGVKWFGTYLGELLKFDNTTLINYNNLVLPYIYPPNFISNISEDQNGNILLATNCSGLAVFDGSNFSVYDTSNSNLPTNKINCIAKNTITGTFWLGTNAGLVEFTPPISNIYTISNSGIPEDVVTAVLFDNAQHLWVGSLNKGLAFYNGTQWSYYRMDNSCLPGNRIYCIKEGPQHKIWVGTDNGLGILTKDPNTSGDDHTSIVYSDQWITLSPNPAKDLIQISSSTPLTNPKLEIITTSGQIVKKEINRGSYNTISLNIHEIKCGIYFLKIETMNGCVVKKLLIQR